MKRKTYSILAIYRRIGGGDPIVRHIAQVSTDDPFYEITPALDRLAHDTPPAGAQYLSAMVTLPVDAEGYAATMAKVNTGRPGVPA